MSVPLFICYSTEDAQHRSDLVYHLGLEDRHRQLEPWWDEKIPTGERWEAFLAYALTRSRVFLALVSQNFFASGYCDREWRRAVELADEGRLRLIPIVLTDCDWRATSLGNYQCLPPGGRAIVEWADPHAAWADVAIRIVSLSTSETTEPPETKGAEAIHVEVRAKAIRDSEITGSEAHMASNQHRETSVDVDAELIQNTKIVGTRKVTDGPSTED